MRKKLCHTCLSVYVSVAANGNAQWRLVEAIMIYESHKGELSKYIQCLLLRRGKEREKEGQRQRQVEREIKQSRSPHEREQEYS